MDFSATLTALSVAGCKVVLVWCLAVMALSAFRPTSAMARRLTPRCLRFLLISAVLAPLPAHADPGPGSLDGLGLPDRPATAISAALGADHVVVPGDSLWSIAATHLGPNPHASTIATSAQAWYAVNRSVIGPNPDVIQPGQRLAAPSGVEQ